MAVLDECAEGGQIGLVQVQLGWMHVEVMTIRLGTAVNGIVLGGRHEFQVPRILSLHSLHEFDAHARREVRILAVGLLTAPPTRIPKDIDVWRPERQALIAAVLLAPQCFLVFGARLIAYRGRLFTQQPGIERRGESDSLGKYGRGPGPSHAVQGFVPPLVGRHTEAGNGRRIVLKLRDLFLQRHARHQIGGALLKAASRVSIDGVVRALTQHRCADGHPEGAHQPWQDPYPDTRRNFHGSLLPFSCRPERVCYRRPQRVAFHWRIAQPYESSSSRVRSCLATRRAVLVLCPGD